MCPRQERQQHFEVQGDCGCTPVGVGFRIVLVVQVLGMSVSQKRFELTIVTREVLRHFSNHRSWDPGEGKGEVLLFSF